MDAKSIYEELLKQGIPEKLVAWSNKADSIDILIQDYNEKVYKEALKFFKGYEDVRVDYTIDHETALWCDNVSKYSSNEFIRSITDFYYTLRAKGLVYTESKKSARKSIKESLNFKKDYEVEVSGGDYWFKPFYWDFDEFRDDLLIASEESGFTYHITTASTSDYRINIEFNNGPSIRYDITFRIIPKSNKETLKELNDYLN